MFILVSLQKFRVSQIYAIMERGIIYHSIFFSCSATHNSLQHYLFSFDPHRSPYQKIYRINLDQISSSYLEISRLLGNRWECCCHSHRLVFTWGYLVKSQKNLYECVQMILQGQSKNLTYDLGLFHSTFWVDYDRIDFWNFYLVHFDRGVFRFYYKVGDNLLLFLLWFKSKISYRFKDMMGFSL